MSKKTATITDNSTGKSIEVPIIHAVHGPPVIDIRKVYKELGMFTFDPGFTSTSSCESEITFIDGEEGILLYRGYPIEQLAKNSSFLEVCYLLWYKELPTATELETFEQTITKHTLVKESLRGFYDGFDKGAHPMAVMVGVVGALSAFYHDFLDIDDLHSREITAHRIIAKMPTIASWAFRYSRNEPLLFPKNSLSYIDNFLYMMFGFPTEDYEVNPVISRALEVMFILHAEHEQNASTSTVRLAGSSQANPYACISAGVSTLWGPAHGGANEAVINMLEEIGDHKNIEKYIAKAKDPNDPFRLMGFGHRVYKNYDPRAKIIRKECYEVLESLKVDDPLFDIALKLEEIALKDPYFIERKLYPNVDFYSGIIQRAIGIPTNMFTVLFVLGRSIGWITQWNEMIQEQPRKIGRPRQLYVGAKKRDYIPVEKR